MIITAESYFEGLNKTSARARLRDRNVIVAQKPKANGQKLKAKINHGRWIVLCPSCNSSEFLFKDNLFYCTECKNDWVDGAVLKVELPKDKTKIEQALLKRLIVNQNWIYPEMLEDLRKENIEHGIGVK